MSFYGHSHNRQGNKNDPTKADKDQIVESYYYTTEASFDVVMWQALTRKSNFIREFMRGDMSVREMRFEDTGDEESGELGPEMILAATSGNPYELDRLKLIKDIERLEKQARSHRSQQSRYRAKIAEADRHREELKREIEEYAKDTEQYEATKGQKFSATINGKVYDDRKVAGNQLAVAAVELPPRSRTKIGSYRGFDLYVEKSKENPHVFLKRSEKADSYPFILNLAESEGAFNSADANLRYASNYRSRREEQLEALERDFETAKAEVDKPYKRAEELEEKRRKLREIQGKIEELLDTKPGKDVRKLGIRLENLTPTGKWLQGESYDIAQIRESMADVVPNKAAFDRWVLALQNSEIAHLLEGAMRRDDPETYVRDPKTGKVYVDLIMKKGWEKKAANVPPLTSFIDVEAQASAQEEAPARARRPQMTRLEDGRFSAGPRYANDPGGVFASLPDRGSVSVRDVASPAEHFYHSQAIVKERGKRGALVYVNDHAKMVLAAALEEVTGRKHYHANALEVARENLQKAVAALESEALANKQYKAEILRTVEEWERILEEYPKQNSFTFHDVTEFAARREAEIPSDREAAARKFKRTSRHERFHWSQRQVVGGQGFAQVGASWAQATKGWGKYRRQMLSRGYPDNPEILAAELAAHFAAEDYGRLELKTEAEIAGAEEWLAKYFERIADRYGIDTLDQFGSLVASASRAREVASTNVSTRQTQQGVAGAQAGAAGGAGNRPPPPGGGGGGIQGGAPGGKRRPDSGSPGIRQTPAFPSSPPPKEWDEELNVGPMPEWQQGLGDIKIPARAAGESWKSGEVPEWQRGLGDIKDPARAASEQWEAGEMPEDQQQLLETKKRRNAADFLRSVGDLWHLGKSLKSSGDISATFRQGLFLTLPPTQWHRAMRAFGRQIRSLKMANYDKFVKGLRAHKAYKEAKAAGLYIASDDARDTPINEREEHFVSEMAQKLPWVRWSEQAYKTYLDSLRLDTFAKYKRVIDKQFRDPGARFEAYQAAAEWLNTSTGRGKFHGRFGQFFDKSLPFLNVFLFAPRYVASRVQMLNPLTYARNLKNPQSRVVFRQQMSELFQSAAMLGTIGALAHAAGASISFDDDDPDFLKLRFGSTRYDVLAGLQQVLRLAFKISRWAAAEMTEDDEKKLRADRADTRDYALRYIRGKLGPSMGFIVDWLNDWTSVTGERHAPGEFISSFGEGDYAKGVADLFDDPIVSQALPLIATDLVAAWYNGYRNTGDMGAGLERTVKALPAGVGLGVQDYDRPEFQKPVKKTLRELGIDPRYPRKDKYETEKEYEARIPKVINDQSVIVQEFQSDQALKGFPKEIQREVLNDAISENGRERMKKLRPEWLHKDWETQAIIEEWRRDMEKNPVFQHLSGDAKKAAMASFVQKMGKYRAHAGKKPTPPRPFTAETVRTIIAKSLNQ